MAGAVASAQAPPAAAPTVSQIVAQVDPRNLVGFVPTLERFGNILHHNVTRRCRAGPGAPR